MTSSDRARVGCAGVVVLDVQRGMVVIVKKRGRDDPWAFGFPKGRLDRGESPAAAAVRELKEETGLGADDVALLEPLCHVDEQLRSTCRYFIGTASSAHVTPSSGDDVDEDLDWARWLSYTDAEAVLPPQHARVLLESRRATCP